MASAAGKGRTFLPPTPGVEEPYRLTPQMALRVAVLGGVVLLVFAALFLRLWALQVLSGTHYLRVARTNQLRTIRQEAPRGPILDRNGRVLVDNHGGTAVALWPADLPDKWYVRLRELKHLSSVVHVPVKEMLKGIAERKGDPLTPVIVKEPVGEPQIAYLKEHQYEFRGLTFQDSFLRHYPHGQIAAQLFGYVSEVSKPELKKHPFGVVAGDKVGQAGIESAFDPYLRGTPGFSRLRVNSLGIPQGSVELAKEWTPGNAVRLTLDLRLQEAAQKALAYGIQLARDSNCYGCWDANGGAIVALDPHDGSVLALASAPAYNPGVYSGRVTMKKLAAQGLTAETAKAKNYPALNRALVGAYPPGSTFKPVTALAAMQQHLVSPYAPEACTGTYTAPEDRGHQIFKNWDPYVNAAIDLPTALAISCDTYFYELGNRFYQLAASYGHPLQAWASSFGFGRRTGIDVGPEASGLLPTPEWRKRTFTQKTDPCCWRLDSLWKPGDSIQLAIGQKDLLVTPLQMARFYALLANGGKLVTPHLLLSVDQSITGGAAPHPAAPAAQQINIDPGALDVVRRGLLKATHDPLGTSSAVFGGFPVPIAGKTGTAEKAIDPGDGIARLFNQSWWCGYGPYDDPKLVVCALIENGGHGGTAAAPTALKVFEQYFHQKAPAIGAIHSD
ncbi:MAG: penicillin-binding protein 2 [Gaiellaceae bacterium]